MKKAIIATVALLPEAALAHTGHDVSGFIGGLAHAMVHTLEGAGGLVALVVLGLGAAYFRRRSRSRCSGKSEHEGQ
jgi:urease accessory protein